MILQKPVVGTTFVVPKQTGTPGDDLVSWGLAMLVSEIAGQNVVLRDDGAHFAIESPVPLDELLERAASHELSSMLRLPWLGSTEKQRLPAKGIEWVDRDGLRDDFERIRQARQSGADQPQGGDAPGVVISDERAKRYPLYRALTNPGTQWNGFNAFVEVVQRQLLSAAGLRVILAAFDEQDPLDDARLDEAIKRLGITKSGDRWRNPPGFLYPGLNKGPTMRLHRESGGTIGPAAHADWRMADRGDRSIIHLYLAYVGYFAVCTLLDAKDEGRAVLVPSPGEVRVPAALPHLAQAAVYYSTFEDYLLARAALAYGRAALHYWQDLRPAQQSRYGGPHLVLRGIHLGIYWMPSGNTYGLRHQGFAPLPAWLRSVLQLEGFDVTLSTIELHERRIANIRGPRRDEKQLSEEQRMALTGYAASLSSGVREWLAAVRAWLPAARSIEATRSLGLWHTDEIGRIVMALDPKTDLLAMIEHESFRRVAGAIRAATVFAHYARINRRQGGGTEEQGFDPDYELITTLSEAADRGPAEFLRALFAFAAHYNDQTMRRNERIQPHHRRAMIRTEDLDQIAVWSLADKRGLVPAALLAYGSSLLPKRDGDSAVEAAPAELVTNGITANGEE